jgi:hypothetical protein
MALRGPGGRLLAALLVAAAVAEPGAARAAEEPVHVVLERDGRFELREYAAVVIAETVVEGDLASASTAGFRRLAGYIFGGNRSVREGGASERIDMTAPVTVQPAPDQTAAPASGAPSERIAMTAPVTVERQDGAAPVPGRPGRWRVQFTMPREWSLGTLPRPTDPSVVLRELPATRQAVLGFTGLAGEEAVRQATEALLAWVAARGLMPVGAPQLARYDPPWTLPFLRRNEVMVTVTSR